MKVNDSIFKSYDIRGVYPSELNEEVSRIIGRAVVLSTGAKKIVVGRDGRLSSEPLFKALAQGINEAGADVVDIGQSPTECLYFCVGFYKYEAGVMITASHNPKEYGGFKVVKRSGDDIAVIRGKDLFLKFNEIRENKQDAPGLARGNVEVKDFWADYFNYVYSVVDVSEIRPMKIAVDASSGMAAKTMSKLSSDLPFSTNLLNAKIDGNFSAHSPNPLAAGSKDEICRFVKENNLDAGFIFDGDADRIFLIDELGNFVPADMTLLLLAKLLIKKNPGTSIAYNVVCSNAVPEFISKWGGEPIRTKVGFVNVREGIMKRGGIMGGELSGHYCFKDYFYLDSGFIAFLLILTLFSNENKKASELVKDLSVYFKESEMNYAIQNKDEVINKIKNAYKSGNQDELDGLTVKYNDWWFNVRSSQTEPVLRLTIEANSKSVLEEKKKELSQLIG